MNSEHTLPHYSIVPYLCRILGCDQWPRAVGSVRWRWSFYPKGLDPIKVSCTIHPNEEKIMVQLSEEQTVWAEVQPVTAKGNPAPIDGEVEWAISDPSVATLEVDPTDSKKAKLTALAGDGARPADVTATFDADLGAGTRTITAIGQIVVADAEAQTAEISFGTPE